VAFCKKTDIFFHEINSGAHMTCPACGVAASPEEVILPGDPRPDRESFKYERCKICDTLSLKSLPSNLGDYYPTSYYSFARTSPKGSLLKKIRDYFSLRGAGPLTHYIDHISVNPRLQSIRPLFDGRLNRRFKLSDKIIDIGCGDGERLYEMRALGFSSLMGIDPFMHRPVEKRGFSLRRIGIDEVTDRHNVIMLHHTLEHIARPDEFLVKLQAVLASGGVLVIRIPIVGKWASREFGREWVQLDPPRHVTLFSEKGFRELAKRTCWKIVKTIYDSGSFQFTGSLLRQRGINIHESPNIIAKHFSRREIRRFETRAAELNAREDGDQAAFFLSSGA
jgi:SAM-dependent methyltransferase